MRPAFGQGFLMVYFLNRHKNSFPVTQFTERMSLYIAVTDSFPCTSVPTAYSRVPAILLVASVHKLCMFLTEPPVRKFRTAGIRTRPLWFSRHQLHLLWGIKKATHRISPMNGSALYAIFYDTIIPRFPVPNYGKVCQHQSGTEKFFKADAWMRWTVRFDTWSFSAISSQVQLLR